MPNYYVQKLFSNIKGTKSLEILQHETPLTVQEGLYASSVLDEPANEIILKLVNSSSQEKKVKIVVKGIKMLERTGSMIILKSDDFDAVNSILDLDEIIPKEETVKVNGK